MDNNELINELIVGTDFEVSSVSSVLTNTEYAVMTPFEAINCMMGGGLPLNSIIHTFGLPKGGKSTWLYQMMGLFQKQYPEGISVILDMESSADPNRLIALGVDPNKVIRLPATSIESGFIALQKMLSNKKNNKKLASIPVFVIWDTISHGLAQDSSSQSRMNAQDRARIIKNYLSALASEISRQPFMLCLINQAIKRIDNYGHPHVEAPGGVALQHEVHMSTKIDWSSDVLDSTRSYILAKWSTITIDKSKLSPELKEVPFKIDVTKGGVIDIKESFIWYMMGKQGLVPNMSGYYPLDTMISTLNEYNQPKLATYVSYFNKKYRYDPAMSLFLNNDILYDILRWLLCERLSRIFSLQSVLINPYRDSIYESIISRLKESNPELFEEDTKVEESTEESTSEVNNEEGI